MGRAPDEDVQSSLRSGTVWVGIASGLSGVFDLATTLACLWLWVSKAELGVATMATALFPVIERIATLGLPSAAVRRADADARVLSSIFWLNLASACTVLLISLVTAPAIGAAFGYPIVGVLVCAYAGKLVGQTIQLVPEARLKHALQFDTLSKLKIGAFLAEASAKLVTAYFGGHGHPDLRIWCFVVGPIASTVVMMVGTQLVRPWRPALVFDRAEAKAAARFGIHLSLADLLYFAYTSADYVVIGSVFGAAALGAYRLAYELVLDVVRLVSMVTAEVAFPAFTRLAGDPRAIGDQLIALTRQNLSLVAPLLVVIGVAAGDLLAILYPPLGPSATTAAQILCVVGALRSVSFVLPAMLAGLGHARDALVYNLVAAIVCPSAFAIAAHGWPGAGYLSVAWAWAASYPVPFVLLVWFALARTRVRLVTYARGLAPVAAWAAVTAAAAMVVHGSLPASVWLRAAAVAAITAASYGIFLLVRRERTAVRG
ncbi:MAG: oligosaccharide flippase family protein [Acidobacteriota bacterium]